MLKTELKKKTRTTKRAHKDINCQKNYQWTVAKPVENEHRLPSPRMTHKGSCSFLRSRKRAKPTCLLENNQIHKAVAAMEEQLVSFERRKHARRHSHNSLSTSGLTSPFSVSSSSDFRMDQGCESQKESGDAVCDELLDTLTRSLVLEESSSDVKNERSRGQQRRGGISVKNCTASMPCIAHSKAFHS